MISSPEWIDDIISYHLPRRVHAYAGRALLMCGLRHTPYASHTRLLSYGCARPIAASTALNLVLYTKFSTVYTNLYTVV
eukprot:SAG11_NODE_2615_length_3170_cov_1.628460_3_plen_79_part_00